MGIMISNTGLPAKSGKIFIVHGWTYTTDKWQELIGLLRLAGFDVVQLAVPGLTEATDKVWTLDDYAEWLKAKLAPEANPVVIGHSNGGRIALALAAKYPGKIKQLILIDSAGIYHNGLPLRIKRAVFGAAAKIGKKITSAQIFRNILYKLAGESDYKNATPQMRRTMANLITADLKSELPKITAPTLIIWGAKDKATTLSDGRLMHKLINKSQFFVIPSAGHSPHFTHASEVSVKIISALKK
jgi:pimeloyl-ACP methyl ester carboxylesterase